MNATLKTTALHMMKVLLSQCNEKQQDLFKRMYANGNLELSINDVVDQMDDDKIDNAFTQCERTVIKNKLKTRE